MMKPRVKQHIDLELLSSTLSKQADLIRRGDLQGAASLTPTLDRLTTKIEIRGIELEDRKTLEDLIQRAKRNDELAQAALKGMKTARSMLEIQSIRSFSSYTAEGACIEIGK